MIRVYKTILIHMGHDSITWDMTHSRGTWYIHMGQDSFVYTTARCNADMSHPYGTWLIHVGHDSFIWDMTHSYGTWLIHIVREMTPSSRLSTCPFEEEEPLYACSDWVMSHVIEPCHIWLSHDTYVTYECVTSYTNESRMTESRHLRMSHVTCKWVTSHTTGIAEVCDVHVRDMGEEPFYACSSDYETDKGAMCALLVPPDRDTVASRCIELWAASFDQPLWCLAAPRAPLFFMNSSTNTYTRVHILNQTCTHAYTHFLSRARSLTRTHTRIYKRSSSWAL